ncbi:hypothetical protein CYMTET_45165 [Cymbomonas tetramitiformis]|uniref:Prefoldin subunit 4 n=1 Tax=Cymbomonas tetramitiformis TaxID=36881 RepID=A0AAE0EYA9_9CHLO|nr:hypothetical protein CYMTET_45166 [Cymbomonas tetramitiformis]KAK3245256.1 hypothetical protein CYMTET_45165 [Cymbomonas tetramitiformis]
MAQGSDMEVTWEDQQNICSFGNLNNRLHEIAAKINANKKLAEDFEEAGNELMITDEEEVKYVLGECFAYLPNDTAESRLERATEELEAETSVLEEEQADIKKKMAVLKQVLYGKFGNSINLEDETQS